MAFAKEAHVREMRQLLLEAGAQENDDAKNRWMMCLRAHIADKAWMENFHKDRDLVPYID